MYTRWRWISPVSLISSSTLTYSGRLKVRSLVRHSSSEYFGSELVVEELELHDLAGEVLDRADLVEQLPQPLVDEPAERLQLELDQVRDRQDLGDPGIALSRRRRLADEIGKHT